MAQQPNFVLIMPDQQRWDSLGCYGNTFTDTPNVDRLAASGARFDLGMTAWPVCTPARGTMWTGVYPHAHELVSNVYKIDDAVATVSRVKTTVFGLQKEQGYLTAHFGKWHLGEAQPAFFDVWEESFNSRFHHWVDGKPEGTYRPDVQTDASIAFLKRHAEGGANQPFMMVQGYYPPHNPFTAPKRFYEPYREKGVPFAGYYACVSNIDWNVGRILDALDETGLRENTVVVYFSDHGETFGGRPDSEHKFVCFEESIRIPFLVSWPGHIAENTVRTEPVGLQDLMPTVLDYAGVPAPAHVHGQSVRPLIEGNGAGWRDAYYVQNVTHQNRIEQRCLRTATHKLIGCLEGRHHLYDLVNDPEEEFDLFALPQDEMPLTLAGLTAEHKPLAENLATRLKAEAESMQDRTGITIANRVLRDLAAA